MVLCRGVLENPKTTITPISTNYTITGFEERIEINATIGNDITITLPEVTPIMRSRRDIEFVRVDESLANVTIVGVNNSFKQSPLDLPIFESFKIYVDSSDQWNDKGYKTEQQLLNSSRSSGVYYIGDNIEQNPDLINNPILEFNPSGTSYDLKFGGVVEIINRDNPWLSKRKFPKFLAQNDITPPSDGIFVILIDINSNTINHQYINQSAELKATDPLFNTDNHVQIGTVSVDQGFISTLQPVIQYSQNISNRMAFLMRTIGIINSASERIRVIPVPGTLNLKITVGDSVSYTFGLIRQGAKAPDADRVSVEVSPAFIITVLRNNTFFSQGFELDVLLFESSPGITTAIKNSRACARFTISFTDFIAVIFGSTDVYTSVVICDQTDEKPNLPSAVSGGLLTNKISILKGVLNLDAALIRDLPRINIT